MASGMEAGATWPAATEVVAEELRVGHSTPHLPAGPPPDPACTLPLILSQHTHLPLEPHHPVL